MDIIKQLCGSKMLFSPHQMPQCFARNQRRGIAFRRVRPSRCFQTAWRKAWTDYNREPSCLGHESKLMTSYVFSNSDCHSFMSIKNWASATVNKQSFSSAYTSPETQIYQNWGSTVSQGSGCHLQLSPGMKWKCFSGRIILKEKEVCITLHVTLLYKL